MQVIETPQTAFCHCVNPMCPGYLQQSVEAVKVETQFNFTDNGGDIPGVERSTIEYRFADEEDAACPSCSRRREVSDQVRPTYDALSGFDPNGLINGVPSFDPQVRNSETDAEVAELKAQVAKLIEKAEAA